MSDSTEILPRGAPRALPAAGLRGIARRLRAPGVLTVMALVTVAVTIVSIAVGAFSIPPTHVVAILADRALGTDLGVAFTEQEQSVVFSVRLPRVVLGALVGAGLGVAGAALQGVFRNPLADATIVGASSGASLGATLTIVAGLGFMGTLTIPVAAFLGALVVTAAVYAFARRRGRTEVVTLVLTGLAFTAICEACVGLITSMANDAELRDLTFWRLGSVGSATWPTVTSIAPIVLLAIVLIPLLARSLNIMALGEREATHLGVHTERVRVVLIALSAMAIGASVAGAGMIAFVGLLVPHLVRLAAGPDHRVVLPGSAIGGAGLLMAADLVARTVAAPVEIPLGVVMGIVGGPFFLFLLHQTRRRQGGWA